MTTVLPEGIIETTTIPNRTTVAVKGKMYECDYVLSSFDMAINTISHNDIKRKLCEDLVQELFNDNSILFTHIRNAAGDKVHYKARIYVTPKDQTQLLVKVNP